MKSGDRWCLALAGAAAGWPPLACHSSSRSPEPAVAAKHILRNPQLVAHTEGRRLADDDARVARPCDRSDAGTIAPAVQSLCTFLRECDGQTDHREVAAALDAIRSLGQDAADAAETLAALLPHRCALYRNRDKLIVTRLRAYIIITLGDIGVPPAAIPALVEVLAHFDGRMSAVEIGAAARAVGTMGARGQPFAPYLLNTISDRLSEEEFTLERYEPAFSPHEATTIQIEAIRALGLVCTPRNTIVADILRPFANDAHPRGLDRRVVSEAANALSRMNSAPKEPVRADAAVGDGASRGASTQ
jgi:hypothetical protein